MTENSQVDVNRFGLNITPLSQPEHVLYVECHHASKIVQV